ncbi:MAG: adenylate/guanylate cyclase domain-containing protein [Treponema sp.]|nr:adenylate/guanylate cyclase domain-containing protein [Treponema sp.]
MKNKNAKIWVRSIIVAAICFAATVALYISGLFSFFENKTYDRRMVFASKYITPCDDISLIIVDQQSIDWAKENYGWGWPWPREAYAHMIDFISAGNAFSLAFDILYTEPSIYGQSDDDALALAEKNSGIVIQPLNVLVDYANEKQTLQFPIEQIKANVATLGAVVSLKDDDDIIRRGRLEYEDAASGKVYPTLGTAPIYMQGEQDNLQEAPRLKDGSVLLRYQSSINNYFPYSAYDILHGYDIYAGLAEPEDEDEFFYEPDEFEDKYVFVAYYAPGLYDVFSTPVSQVFPGVGVHITTLDNYLTDSFMRKAPEIVSYTWILLLALFGSIAVTFASLRNSQRLTVFFMAAGFIIGLVLVVAVPYLLFAKGIWLVLVAPAVSFFLSFLICVALSLTVEGKQKRFIKSAFSQCLSKDVVNQIMNDPSSFTLGGKNFQMTAIFTDIQKFSSFSELLTAAQLGSLLNFYLTRMSDIIIDEHGTVDKYEGDAIVALVGAPVEMEDHAVRACAAAIKMKKAEAVMNKEIEQIAAGEKPADMEQDLYDAFKIMVANKKVIFTRIGMNSGEMIAGYFGSENKKNYTMMGNNVNLASRLEGVNKQYHTNGILISAATRDLLGDEFIVRSLDRVRVVNVNTPLRLYELLETREAASPELLQYVDAWEKAFADFEAKEYKGAAEQFKALAAQNENDNVVRYYLELLNNFFLKGKYPVAADDVGVEYNPEDSVFKLMQK